MTEKENFVDEIASQILSGDYGRAESSPVHSSTAFLNDLMERRLEGTDRRLQSSYRHHRLSKEEKNE